MRETISQFGVSARVRVAGAMLALSMLAVPSVYAQDTARAGGETGSQAAPEAMKRVEAKEHDYSLIYIYPRRLAAIPPVEARLQADLKTFRQQLRSVAKEARRDRARSGEEFIAYTQTVQWTVAADTPGWLSLSGNNAAYIGGAHGTTMFTYLLWDKAGKRDWPTLSLFSSPAALDAALQPALCDELDRERAKRRGEPVVRDPKNWATTCLTVQETVPVLASSDGQKLDQIRILIAPYIAGPYSEGSYELALPVTPAVLAAVKPEFQAAFAVGR